MDAAAVTQVLREALPGASISEIPTVDMPTIAVDRGDVLAVCRTLRDHSSLQFALLADVTAVDYHPADPRFEVVYLLACLGEAYAAGPAAPARRLRVKARLPAEDARITSVVGLYPVAGWLEREVFDLMGVVFEGHPDLRRILTSDGWEGHPLRKDYPVQIRKDAASSAPLQVSVEEFAKNIRDDRARAASRSEAVKRPEADRAE